MVNIRNEGDNNIMCSDLLVKIHTGQDIQTDCLGAREGSRKFLSTLEGPTGYY